MNTTPFNTRATRRLALLQHGGLLGRAGKTGLSLLRYCAEKVAVVIDRECAGRSLADITRLPSTRMIPIVANMAEALAHVPDAVAIGIAPPGGRLPDDWLLELRTAARHGVSIWNGLHTSLATDAEIANSQTRGSYVWDMRQEPAGVVNGRGLARNLPCSRILFVGTDMAIGKMTAALEFDRAARRRGFRSKFIATGQAGMMIAGEGVCLDAVRVDFASGAVEAEIMRAGAEHDFLWVEGQGSLLNPASTATLPLIRGTQPTHLVLVHRARMTHLQEFAHIPVPPLDRVVALYEMVAAAGGAFPPVAVSAVALNTWTLSEADARAEIAAITAQTGLPCADVVRSGADSLLDAIFASPESQATASVASVTP